MRQMAVSARMMVTAVLIGVASTGQAQNAMPVSPGSGGVRSGTAANGGVVGPIPQERPDSSPRAVTLDLRNVTVREALQEVEHQSGVHLYYSRWAVPVERRVSLRVQAVSAENALRRILTGTGVEVRSRSPLQIVLERPDDAVTTSRRVQSGVIRGRVTDAKTGDPIAGVQIVVTGERLGAVSTEDGSYRIASVPAGTYRLSARRIGYTPADQEVTVAADQEAVVDFALHASATALDQVVVTGTVAPTEVRAVSTPIAVVTADQIARLGITDIDQLFRGTVPGAVAVDAGTHDGYPGLSFRGGVDFNQAYADAPAKVYVDGVEVAYTNAISQIDPSTIDHIEITRGPQASTLYGAGAMAGVIQIFTKRGARDRKHPVIEAQVAAGALESQWSDATLHQDHAIGITGGTDALTYSAHASYVSTGAWTPEYRSHRAAYGGSIGTTLGALRLDLSGEYSDRLYNVPPVDPFFVSRVRDGTWHTSSDAFYLRPFNPDVQRTDETIGVNATYQARPGWVHHLVLGYDGYDNPRGQTAPRLTTPTDTLRSYSEFESSRASVVYNTTVTTALGSHLSSALTLGVDHWQTHQGVVSAQEHANGSFAPGAVLIKYAYANTGLLAQEQLGIADALFITAGIRGDRNDNFGSNYGTAIAPRVGVSYAGQAADVRYKLRASWGKAIKAPLPTQKDAISIGLPFSEQLANPALGPESQEGVDAGLELYFGQRTSVQATYYDQHVDNLISSVLVSAPEDTVAQYQNRNVGRIRNSGWEFQGTTTLASLTLSATYSIFNSTAQRVSAGSIGDGRGQYHVGDRVLLIPRSVGGLTAGYKIGGTGLGAGLTYIGSFRNYDLIAYYQDVLGGGSTHQPARAYIMDYPSSVKWNASVTQAIGPSVDMFLRVDNLTNSYRAEVDDISAVHGRLTVLGMKVRL